MPQHNDMYSLCLNITRHFSFDYIYRLMLTDFTFLFRIMYIVGVAKLVHIHHNYHNTFCYILKADSDRAQSPFESNRFELIEK